MAVTIQLRRDTTANWASTDPTLAAGEIGVDTDLGKFKIGDGATAWSSLAFASQTPDEIASAVAAATSALIDAAPGALDTLNELAAALGDDPDFAGTVTAAINLKADDADLTSHTSATTSVHGITDTSALETQTGAQAKATAAETAANTYTDGEITTATAALQAYADQAESDAVTASNTYTDAEVAAATSALQAYADLAESDAVATAAADATAKANAAEAAANAYTDGQVSDLIQAAPGALDTLNELAAAINDDENFAATVATNLSNAVTNLEAYADQAEADAVATAAADASTKATAAETAAKAYTDAEIATATTSLQAYADTAESDAVTAANAYTDGEITAATTALQAYADTAESDAVTAAALDATTKANAAQAAAEATASADATAKANAAEAAANTYTDAEVSSATTALQSYADTAEADAVTAAALDATTKANAAETAAKAYTDGEITTATTSLQTYADQAEADAVATAAADATTKANAAQAAAISAAAADATSKADSAETAAKTYSDNTFVPLTQKGAANGVPTLDGNSKIPSSQIPAVAIVDTFVVADETAMLALTAQQGDVAVRTDLNKSFILSGSDPALLSDWQELLSPTDAVASVDGRTGVVSLSDLYDASGSAATAQAAAESYADSLAPNYDPAGSAAAAQTAAEAYADGLAVNYDAVGSASAAQTAAESYADSLAVNYDPAGSAAAAQSAAQAYADALDTDDVAEGLTNQYFTAQRALDATASAYDPAGSAAAAQSAAQTYADQAEADAIATAAADATTKADAAEAAANTYTDNIIVNGGDKAASIAPVPTIWDTVTVAGDVLTTSDNTGYHSWPVAEMSRFIGRRVRITFPSCVFTATVGRVGQVDTWNVSLVLLDITMESGSYPADGAVSVAGTTWLEDTGEFNVVLDSEPSFSGHVYGTAGKSMYYQPVEEVIGQITGPSTLLAVPQPVASDWTGAQWLSTYDYPFSGEYAIVAQWTGPSDTVPVPENTYSANTHTFEFTIPGGDTVTINTPSVSVAALSPTWDATLVDGGVTSSQTVGFWGPDTFQNGVWYGFSFWSWDFASSVNLDTNPPPSWTGYPSPSGTPQDITSFTITPPAKNVYAYPTTISNPRTTYLNHSLYGFTGRDYKMALRFSGSAAHDIYFAYLGPDFGFTDESGTSLVSTSSSAISIARSEDYPIDIVALAPSETTGIAFRGSSGELQGIRYDKTKDGITNYDGRLLATDNSAINALEALGLGTPYAAVDMSTFTSTLVATNVPHPSVSGLTISNLYKTEFKLQAGEVTDAFWASQYASFGSYYPVLYTDSRRAVAYDWWRDNDFYAIRQIFDGSAYVASASRDVTTQVITLYTDRDLTPAANNYLLPENGAPYSGFFLRLMAYSGHNGPTTYQPSRSTNASGLSTGTFAFDGTGAPGRRGALLTSMSPNGNLSWRPTPGLVTKRFASWGSVSQLTIDDLEFDAYSGAALGGAWSSDRKVKIMKLLIRVTRDSAGFSPNHDMFMRFNPSSPVVARYATVEKAIDSATGTGTLFSASGSGGASYVNLGRAGVTGTDSGQYIGDLLVTMSFRPQGTKFESTWLPGGNITKPNYATSGATTWTNAPSSGGLEFYIAPTDSGTRMTFKWDVKAVVELHREF